MPFSRKARKCLVLLSYFGERAGIRTLDLLIKSPSLDQTAARLLSPTPNRKRPVALYGPIRSFAWRIWKVLNGPEADCPLSGGIWLKRTFRI